MTKQSSEDFPSRGPWIIAVLALVAVVVVVGVVFTVQRQKSDTADTDVSELLKLPEDFDVSTLKDEKVNYDLACTRITDGIVEEAAEKLEFPTTRAMITLNIDVVFPFFGDKSYTVIIEEYHGEELYKVWIPPQYLTAGSVPLNLDGGVFGPGTYRLEIIEEGSDSVTVAIAESMFEITE